MVRHEKHISYPFQVSGKAFEKNFTDIMKHYRNQPQATSHVYRSVLLAGKASSGSPSHQSGPISQSNPPPTPGRLVISSISVVLICAPDVLLAPLWARTERSGVT